MEPRLGAPHAPGSTVRRMEIGLVGCGNWGRLILRDLVDLGCRVVVVARSERSRSNAREGGAGGIVGSVDELPDCTGIVVATPTVTHADVLDEVVDRGVPVFVEKPMTADAAAARRLAARAPDRLFVMDKWRYHPGVQAMAAMAASGEYGPLRAIHSRRLSWGQPHDDVDATWILLPHDLSIVLEVSGRLPAAAFAAGRRGAGSDSWMTAHLGPDPRCVLEVSSMSPTRERRVMVEFEEATAELGDAYADALRVLRPGSDPDDAEEIPIPAEMPLHTELGTFVAHLDGGPPPRSSASEGALIVTRIAELRSLAGL